MRDETFNAVLSRIGAQGSVELTGLVGYYTLVAMTLNAFEVPLPGGVMPLMRDCPTF